MGKNYCLTLLILCAVLAQVTAYLSKEDTEQSSELLIREKRLISIFLPPHKGVSIQHSRHLVNILRSEVSHCAGNILLPNIIIAPASCFEKTGTYVVLSGSTQRNRGMRHSVRMIIPHKKFNPLSYDYDLSLVKIDPPVGRINHPIERTEKPLYPHSSGYITGWGCGEAGPKGVKIIHNELQIIEIGTIQYFQCQRFYKFYGENTTLAMQHFCTYDPNKHKRSCEGGTPFIKNGKLAGIMPYREHSVTLENPQVFLDVGHPDIKEWIDVILREFLAAGK